MCLMEHETPSCRTFGLFINEVLGESIKEIFKDINQKIFETEYVDLWNSVDSHQCVDD